MADDPEDIQKANRFTEMGVASDNDPSWGLRQDEFLPDLRGVRGIKRLREMSENDSTIGAILAAMSLMVRSTPWRVEGGSDEARNLVDYSLHHMQEASFQDFIGDVLSFLTYGFSLFEIVARPARQDPNGWVTLKKLAPRAQWTIDRFITDERNDIVAVQQLAAQKGTRIPYGKLLHFRTTSNSGDPSGRSVLRAAYSSWYFANRIREIEAVAIERELNGVPLLKMPSEYLASDASVDKKKTVEAFKRMGRDLKKNEMGFALIPSDPYQQEDGTYTSIPMMSLELIASQGRRDIDTDKVILRYEQSMARSALADFVTLGSNDRGSFALSKSKADLFLRALTGYMDSISAVLNRKLIPTLCQWNGIPEADHPKISHGTVAPTDLGELGQFIQRLSLSGMDVAGDADTQAYLREVGGFPPQGDRPARENLDGTPDPDPVPPPRPAPQQRDVE